MTGCVHACNSALRCRGIDPEADAASLKGARLIRYHTPQQARLERDRGLKKLKLGRAAGLGAAQPPGSRLALPLPAYIPLSEFDKQVGALCTSL